MAFKIGNSDPGEVKIAGEQETRRKLIGMARGAGCEKDLLLILDKYDRLMRVAKDDRERADIGKLGVVEVNKLLGLDQVL